MTKRAHDRVPQPADAAPGAPDGARDASRPDDAPPSNRAEPTLGAPDAAGEDEMASDVAAAVTVESLQALLEEARDRSLRAQAELENFRKRTVRSLDEERRFAALPLVRDLLPVVDNLQRALAAAEQHDTGAGLLEGVQLVATQLAAILDRHHCALIPAEPGCAFDPHLHEAMAQLPATDCPPGHICHVLQPGYQLYDRVIRPAQVIVAALAPDARSVSPEREATTDPASREAVPPDTDA